MGSLLSPFLKMGVTHALVHSWGTWPESSDFWKSTERNRAISLLRFLRQWVWWSPVLMPCLDDIAMTSTSNVLTTELLDLLYIQCTGNMHCFSVFIYPTAVLFLGRAIHAFLIPMAPKIKQVHHIYIGHTCLKSVNRNCVFFLSNFCNFLDMQSIVREVNLVAVRFSEFFLQASNYLTFLPWIAQRNSLLPKMAKRQLRITDL